MTIVANKVSWIYGLPVYKTKIDPKLYEKKKILSQIEKNYKIAKIRNKWSTSSYLKTDIHQSVDDDDPRFKQINYHSLPYQYEKIIADFFHRLAMRKDFKSSYDIVNYTCVRHNSIMIPHIHTDCTFSLVHYLSFDKVQHLPTIFKNPYYFNHLLPYKENLRDIFANKEENSWLYQEWIVGTEEDDVIITPAVLEHYVRNSDSKKSRITIIVNIRTHDQS
tara:strand:+ start:1416 stop:2075 length:660 start_codon:yes stop_codon:yes gene_type:complete